MAWLKSGVKRTSIGMVGLKSVQVKIDQKGRCRRTSVGDHEVSGAALGVSSACRAGNLMITTAPAKF
jgi:hypothetical protein